jgi:hypothetical protein
MVNGWPPRSANNTPPIAVTTSISIIPISLPVSKPVNAPKAMAFASAAKYKNSVVPATLECRPSLKSPK